MTIPSFSIQYWRDEIDAFIKLDDTIRDLKCVDEARKYVPKAYLLPNTFIDLVYNYSMNPKLPYLDVYEINMLKAYGCAPLDQQPTIYVVPLHNAVKVMFEAQDLIIRRVYLQAYSDQIGSLVLVRPVLLADPRPATIPPRSQQLSPPAASQEGEESPGSLSDSGTPTDSHPENGADKT